MDKISIFMLNFNRKYTYKQSKRCCNPLCNNDIIIRIIGDKESPEYGLPIPKDRKKIACSRKCHTVWQKSIPWEERVGKEFANSFREKMSILSSINNPSTFPGVASKISSGLKKYISANPGVRNGENNPFYGKKHSDVTKNYLKKSKQGIRSYSEEQRIKQLENTPRKENHPNWLGGISNGEYGHEFNKELKQNIKEKFNYTCQICGILEKELDVHHIDYDKKNNLLENLIPLCKTCHGKTNYNREMWQKILNERKKD